MAVHTDEAPAAVLVPESTACLCCTVFWVQVVVSVERCEHLAVLVAKRITAGVTRVA